MRRENQAYQSQSDDHAPEDDGQNHEEETNLGVLECVWDQVISDEAHDDDQDAEGDLKRRQAHVSQFCDPH